MAGAPKTYSFAQFHQKTGGNQAAYIRYLNYIANYRSHQLARSRAAAGGGGFNPGAVSSGIAPQPYSQFLKQSRQYVNSIINPQLAQINKTYANDVARNRQAIMQASAGMSQGAAQALANMKNLFGGQASMLSAITGGTTADQALQQAGAQVGLQSYLNNMGVAGQGVAGGYAPSAVSNTQTGGQIAQGQGGNNATAALGYFNFLPANARTAGAFNMRQTLAGLLNAKTKQVSGITSQVPGLMQQLYQHYLDQELNKQVASLGLAKTDITQLGQNYRQGVTASQPDYSGSKAVGAPQVLTKSGAVFIGPNGKPIKITYRSGTTKKAADTALGKAQSAMNAARGYISGAGSRKVVSKPGTPGIGAIPGTPPTYKTVKGPIGYFKAINVVYAAIYNILHPFMSDNQIRIMSQQYVNQLPFYPPGHRGRPPAQGKSGTPKRRKGTTVVPLPRV